MPVFLELQCDTCGKKSLTLKAIFNGDPGKITSAIRVDPLPPDYEITIWQVDGATAYCHLHHTRDTSQLDRYLVDDSVV